MFGKGNCGPMGHQAHGAFAGFGPGPMGAFGKFGGKCGPGQLFSELNLTDEQLLRIAELKGRAFGKIARGKLDLMDLKKEAFKELLQPQVDKAKVKALAEQVKARKSDFIDHISDNMIEFSELLTPEQKSKLRISLVKKFLGVDDIEDDEL